MWLSELAEAAGVSIPTIKFYLREGLLPPGELVASNRARYGEGHLHRLSLIRALVEVGGLTLTDVRRVLEALDDPAKTAHQVLGVAHRTLSATPGEDLVEDLGAARREVDAYLEGLGWRVASDAPARAELAWALTTLRRLGREVDTSAFDSYAEAARRIAAGELNRVQARAGDRAQMVESAVVGTVIFERVLAALRRLAQEHESARRYGAEAG